MRAVMLKSQWLSLLGASAGIVEKKAPNFAATCYLLEVGEFVCARATDGTIAVLSTGTRVQQPKDEGAAAIPAASLLERIRACAEGDVEVKASDGKAQVKGGERKFSLRSLDPAEFPPIAKFPKGAISNKLSAAELRRLIGVTLYAVHQDPGGMYRGALFRFGSGGVRVDAMTNAGMAMASAALKKSADVRAMVDLKPLTAIKKTADDAGDEDEVSIRVAGSLCSFDLGDVEFLFPLIADNMPDMDPHLPPVTRRVRVGREALMDSMSAAGLSCDKGVELKSDGAVLVVSGHNSDGDIEDRIPCEGDALVTWVPPWRVKQALATLETEMAVLELGADEMSPLLVKPLDDESIRHVLMPLVREMR